MLSTIPSAQADGIPSVASKVLAAGEVRKAITRKSGAITLPRKPGKLKPDYCGLRSADMSGVSAAGRGGLGHYFDSYLAQAEVHWWVV